MMIDGGLRPQVYLLGIVMFCVPTWHRSVAVDHHSECKVVECITFPRPFEGETH